MTVDQFTSALATDTEYAVSNAADALDALIRDLQGAREALTAAAAGEPFSHGALDLYGNRLVDAPKACTKAYELLMLNARAQKIEATS